jgi:hypothetical protein
MSVEAGSTTGTLVDDGDYPPADKYNSNANNSTGNSSNSNSSNRRQLPNVSTNSRSSESKDCDDTDSAAITTTSTATAVLSPKRNGSQRSSADRNTDGRRSSNEGTCQWHFNRFSTIF